MAIEEFSQAEFAAVLKAIDAGPVEPMGVIEGEYAFNVKPRNGNGLILMVRSTVRADGMSAGVAQDSIRVWPMVALDDATLERLGGKSIRWIDRRRLWQDRLAASITALSIQARWCRPCPHCDKQLVPFTVQKAGPNKGKGFVKCCNPACDGIPEDRKGTAGASGFWSWAIVEPTDADFQAKPKAATVAAAQVDPNSPACPTCSSPMQRMKSGKGGWRCSKAGRYFPRTYSWSGCNGVIWDDGISPQKAATVAATGGSTVQAKPNPVQAPNAAIASVANVAGFKVDAATLKSKLSSILQCIDDSPERPQGWIAGALDELLDA